jgi:hypothetical protein
MAEERILVIVKFQEVEGTTHTVATPEKHPT